jgi:hypothetical protein
VSNLAGAGTRMVGSDANGTLVNIAAGTNGQVLTQTAGGPAWQPISAWQVTGNAGKNGGSIVAAGVNSWAPQTSRSRLPEIPMASMSPRWMQMAFGSRKTTMVSRMWTSSWIAMDVRKGSETLVTSPEILDADFDRKMNDVMRNEHSNEVGGSLLWDGTQVRFDTPQAKTPSNEVERFKRPTGPKPN